MNVVKWLTEEGLSFKGHKARLNVVQGWGEPVEYTGVCSCGWRSRTYSYWGGGKMAPAYQAFEDKWGADVFKALSKDDFTFENAAEQAAGLLLDHLDFSGAEAAADLIQELKETHEELVVAISTEDFAGLAEGHALGNRSLFLIDELKILGKRYGVYCEGDDLRRAAVKEEEPPIPLEAYKEYKKLTTPGGSGK